jgi:hypothetical protein
MKIHAKKAKSPNQNKKKQKGLTTEYKGRLKNPTLTVVIPQPALTV